MFRFSTIFKLKVVSKYLSNIGSTTLNHLYGINGSATVLEWVHKYNKYGYKGLVVSHTKKVYPFRYKLKVLNWMKIKYKSHSQNNLTKYCLNQLELLEKQNLKLSVQLKYQKLLKYNNKLKSINTLIIVFNMNH